MKAVLVAARGKGIPNTVRRAGAIGASYGFGPGRMDGRIDHMVHTLDRFACRPTLPITASVAERNLALVTSYSARGVEFAVHGYHHVDHTALTADQLQRQLVWARLVLEEGGVDTPGFRAPYLRADDKTLAAVRDAGFLFDSSQAMHWPLSNEGEDGGVQEGEHRGETESYRRALTFYGAIPATERPVLPTMQDGLVRIPYCLPDDEAVVDRLRLSPAAVRRLWLGIFERTYERGELLTLGVHPERIAPCADAIASVLDTARSRHPAVWIARLDEIARWWRDRASATVSVQEVAPGHFHAEVRGPSGLLPAEFDVTAERRPTVGVHPTSPAAVTDLLRDHGFVVEPAECAGRHACFVRRERFDDRDALSLLAELESSRVPLVRLARWPNGARAALSVTGDVDALTIRDYTRRLNGR